MSLHYLGKHESQKLRFHLNFVYRFTNKDRNMFKYHLVIAKKHFIISKLSQ